MKLTPKQEKFCQEFVKLGVASQAYRNSYSTKKMTEKSIWETSSRMMADVKVSSRISVLRKEIAKESIADAQEIQSFWTKTLREEAHDMKDRVKCSELLGKCIGIFEKDNKQKGEALSKCFLPMKNKDN